MANQWFRMYSEFATDPKVQMMSEQNQRRLLMLLCLRCNGDVTFHDKEMAFQLRISDADWVESKREFISRGFIDEANKVLNWDKRQYRSDSSAERVRKHREAKRNDGVTSSNVTVTPPDTEQIQNRIEKKIKQKKIPEGFEEFWKAYPKRRAGSRDYAFTAYLNALSKGATEEQIIKSAKAYAASEEATADGGKFAKGCAAWLNADRWTDATSDPPAQPILAADGLPVGWVPSETDYSFAKKMLQAGNNPTKYQAYIRRYEEQVRH